MRYCIGDARRGVVPVVSVEFLIPLFGVRNIGYQPLHLLLFLFATTVNLLLLFGSQQFELFLRNLHFEVDGDVGSGSWRSNCIGGGVVVVRRQMGFLLFVPGGDSKLTKTLVPGVGAVRLRGSKLSRNALREFQVRFANFGTWAGVVVKPHTDSLTRGMRRHNQDDESLWDAPRCSQNGRQGSHFPWNRAP